MKINGLKVAEVSAILKKFDDRAYNRLMVFPFKKRMEILTRLVNIKNARNHPL